MANGHNHIRREPSFSCHGGGPNVKGIDAVEGGRKTQGGQTPPHGIVKLKPSEAGPVSTDKGASPDTAGLAAR